MGILIITLSLILWFGIKTLHRLFLIKFGNIKSFGMKYKYNKNLDLFIHHSKTVSDY